MHFIAAAASQSGFDDWIHRLQNSPDTLGQVEYGQLAEPGHDKLVRYFSSAEPRLFDQIVAKYEAPVFLTPASGAL
jgi:cytochrome o ubiquinol oxidase subunit 2